MQWISKALCRFGCASMASVLCLVPYLGYLLLRMEVASAVLFFVFGLYMAFKGMISLTALSFILDEWLLNRLLERMANKAGVGLRVWIYLVIGAVLAAVLYGGNSVFIGAGLMTSLIYVLMLQKILPRG
ncbi:hypothetical protein [Paenibacillus sp. FSL W8-0194]|uniref:hypothetical protein n=1 Tax=Paenibacillus sp. FSL W8-0194 TaxID=2921711 RepID=UPI0030D8376C